MGLFSGFSLGMNLEAWTMTVDFDPYYQWLGIPPAEQPVTKYRLLGLADLEAHPDVIESAADRQMAHVRTFQTGPRADLCQQILNELSDAKLCLLDPKRKAIYDQQVTEDKVKREQGNDAARDRRPLTAQEPVSLSVLEEDLEPYRLVPLKPVDSIASLPGVRRARRRVRRSVYQRWKTAVIALAVCLVLVTAAVTFGPTVWQRWVAWSESHRPGAAAPSPVGHPRQESESGAKGGAIASTDAAILESSTKPAPILPRSSREQQLKTVLDELNSSIVLRMTFDRETVTEGTGDKVVKDLSGYGNHGTIHGATLVPGVRGEALSFHGRSYVDCGNARILDPVDAFSLSAWVFPIRGPDYPRIVSKEMTYQLRWQSYYADPGPLRFTGALGTIRAAATPPYGEWHYIVVTFGKHDNQAVLRMYHDGALIADEKPEDSRPGNPEGHLYLGVSGRNNRYEHYQGFLDELTILNREMNAREIQAMYRAIASHQ